MMKLEDTVQMMASDDYKERFRAEYWQLKIRYEKLKNFNTRIEAAEYDSSVQMPAHNCCDELLRRQQSHMGQYLRTLEVRAIIEGIDLNKD